MKNEAAFLAFKSITRKESPQTTKEHQINTLKKSNKNIYIWILVLSVSLIVQGIAIDRINTEQDRRTTAIETVKMNHSS